MHHFVSQFKENGKKFSGEMFVLKCFYSRRCSNGDSYLISISLLATVDSSFSSNRIEALSLSALHKKFNDCCVKLRIFINLSPVD